MSNFDRYTDRARKVLALAHQEAERLGDTHIGTEHILLGISKEGSGVGANALLNLNVDFCKVREEVQKITKKDSEPKKEKTMEPITIPLQVDMRAAEQTLEEFRVAYEKRMEQMKEVTRYDKKPPAFQVGDVVQLKSGGPAMTLALTFVSSKICSCKWFDGSDLKADDFNSDILQPYKPQIDAHYGPYGVIK